ncbi:MAG: T9SS type A sorting domain-containing protein, partial [Bacteroidota bacterium]
AATVTRNGVGATDILFPIGPTTSAYDPVTINNAGTAGAFSAKVKVGFDAGIGPTDPSVVVDRQWTITEIGGGKNATVTFQYNSGEFLLASFDVTNNFIARHNGTQWLTTAATETFPVGGPFTSSASGFTSFSPFGITSNTSALPIQLASFTGTFVNGGVRLNWRTLSEINNYGFFVQRRAESGEQFVDVPNSFVAGHGTTNEPHNYTFTDNTISAGSWQYRLKQVDLDGTIHFTEPINVSSPTSVKEIAPIEFALEQNYPNPFNPETNIKFSVEETARATLEIYNLLGQKVATLFDDVVEAGYYQTVKFDGANLASGMYLYRLQSGQKSDLKKLMLLK